MTTRRRAPALVTMIALVLAGCSSAPAATPTSRPATSSAPAATATTPAATATSPAATATTPAATATGSPAATASPTTAPTSAAPSPTGTAAAEIGVDDGSTITMWSRAATQARVSPLVEAYNATHKNKIELRIVPTDEYVGVVGNAAQANELPDLFSADVVFMPNWTSQGLFTDLTAQIDALPFIDDVGQAHIVGSSWEGKKYGLPFIIDLSVWMYNKKLFRDAGLDPEAAPKTLKEFADAARAVQKLNRPGVYGTSFGGNCGGCNVFTWWPIAWAQGDEVMNAEGTEAILASPTMKEIYKTFGALWDEGVIHPDSRQEAGPTWTAAFKGGTIGVMPMPASLEEIAGLPLDDLGITPIAGTTSGQSTFVGGDSIGVSRDSEKVDQAWNFISWMLGDYAQVEVVAKAGNVVARKSLASNQYSSADPRLVTFNEIAGVGKTPFALHFNAAFNDAQSPWIQLFRAAVFDDAADAKIDELNAAITAVLKGD